jgi:ATP-binding cassette subfamily B protein
MISGKEFRKQLGVHRWAYGVLWRVNRFYTVGLILCGFLAGMTPVLLFMSLRGLIDDQLSNQGKGVQNWLFLLMWVGIAEAVVGLAHKLFRNLLRERALVEINELILRRSLLRPVSFFEQSKSVNQLEKIKSNSAERLVELVGRNSQIIASLIQIVTISVMLARIEPLILVVVPPCFLPYLWFQLRLGSKMSEDIQERAKDRRRIGYFVGLLTLPQSVAETRLLGISDHLISQFRAALSTKRDEEAQKDFKQFIGGSLFSILCTILFVGLIYRMLMRPGGAAVGLGSIVFFAASSIRLRKSLEDATHSLAAIADHQVYAASLKQFIDGKDDETPIAKTPLETADGIRTETTEQAASFRSEICFENVSFRYEGQEHLALSDVSFTIHPGETIAIVGENGSGKSTLVKLIAGIYKPESGTIRIDGRSLADHDMDDLYQKIAFVFQDFGRYNVTLLENVAYGNWAKYSKESEADLVAELQPSIARVGLEKELTKMPKGLQTVLGRTFGEYEPSGGVWQKIALARAFAKKAPILIMDEPSSAIDARAEFELFGRISDLSEGRTTVLISHRFSTVSMATRIFVIDRGRLVEEGNHADLMKLNGRYAMLYNYHKKLHGEGGVND